MYKNSISGILPGSLQRYHPCLQMTNLEMLRLTLSIGPKRLTLKFKKLSISLEDSSKSSVVFPWTH